MVVDIAPVVVLVHTTVFGFIAVTGDLIGFDSLVDCKSLADYARLLIQRIAVEVMIDLVTGEFAAYVNAARGLAAWGEGIEFVVSMVH